MMDPLRIYRLIRSLDEQGQEDIFGLMLEDDKSRKSLLALQAQAAEDAEGLGQSLAQDQDVDHALFSMEEMVSQRTMPAKSTVFHASGRRINVNALSQRLLAYVGEHPDATNREIAAAFPDDRNVVMQLYQHKRHGKVIQPAQATWRLAA